MGFLRRLLGGGRDDSGTDGLPTEPSGPAGAADGGASADELERAHELELARFEQARTTDLMRRQQRYEDRSWTPPAQGGPERSDDEGAAEE